MIEAACSQCNQTGQILSNKGLCWNCHTTKEKTNYRYMINCKTQLLLSTILLCILFLLNAIPTIRLGHEFTQNYSKITNDYIRIGKDIFFLLLYLILKISFVITFWKHRYTQIGSKYINLLTEFIVFIAKLIVMNRYLTSPLKAELRLSGLIEKLNQYTEDNLSSEYIAFFLKYFSIFLIIRLVSCIFAYLLNLFLAKYYKSFFAQRQFRRRVNNIAHWEFYYKKHPAFCKSNEDQMLAANSERTIVLEEEALRKDIANYIQQDDKRINHFVQCLQSDEDTLSFNEADLAIYYTYIKDKISVWKEDNLTTDNNLDHGVIESVTNKFNCIRERYQSCSIENQTYFNIYQRFMNEFEGPLKQIMNQRRNVRQAIEQLYIDSDILYWSGKCKEDINETVELFEKQTINLSDYNILLDGETISFDHVLITNRGLFILDLETFDSTNPFELLIERDGNWYKRYLEDSESMHLESLTSTIPTRNNHNLLKLEKHLNQLLNRPLDQYIEFKGIVILSNDDIILENNSSQTVIRAAELVTVLRSYPIQYNEEQMLHIKSLLVSQQVPTANKIIPNYRKQIIEPLDTLLEEKIQLVQTNLGLIHQINQVALDITKKNKYNLIPLYIK